MSEETGGGSAATHLLGRVALVTGAAKGIGAAVATHLAAAGAAVAVADVDEDGAAALAKSITEAGGQARAYACDVRDFEQVSSVAEAVANHFGRVDLLVANAGIGDYSMMSDGDPERWQALIGINVLGVAHCVRAVLPSMKARGSGDVVIMASIAGREAWAGEPIYIASKHAEVGLAKSLRLEAARDGVRVSLIEPSIVDTPLVRSTEQGRTELASYASLSADDIARAVVFAVSQPPGVNIAEIVVRAVGAEA